jgi:hypothetical protein
MEWLGVIYAVVASVLGWKFMTNKVAWLEEKKPLNQVMKVVVSIVVGQVVAVFYAVALLLKGVGRL